MGNNRHPKFLFYLISVVGVCVISYFVFLIPTIPRAKISSELASLKAKETMKLISLSSEMHLLDLYNMGVITSSNCYKGEAYLLFGTNLDETEVSAYFEDFFRNWGWNIYSGLDVEPYRLINVTSLEVDGYGRTIDSVSIRKCDAECVSEKHYDERIANENLERYENLYLIRTWHLPFEISNNLCWCCSGG